MAFEDFIKEVKKVHQERHHKVTNSYGSKDAFHYYRKIRPKENKYILTDCEYLHIIRLINNVLQTLIIEGADITFPERMGRLEVRKRSNKIKFNDGKLVIDYPINWDATLKLWYEHPECKIKKQLVREESLETFRIYYNRSKANYNNKTFYEFTPNRNIKIGLKNNIKRNKIEAYKYGI